MIASSFLVMLAGERAFAQPRIIREAPNGDLFVADSRIDALRVLRLSPGHATPLRDEVFARGLKHPFGIAFYPVGSNPRWIYIASSSGLVRLRYRNGDLEATGKPEQITAGTPTLHQYARGVAFSPDGHRLYFSLGSARTQVVATGPRTCQDMTVQPAAGELSCIVDEHDESSNDTPQSAPLQMGVQGDRSSRALTRTAAVVSESVQTGDNAARSRDLYLAHCAACHQAGGEGVPGVFPPSREAASSIKTTPRNTFTWFSMVCRAAGREVWSTLPPCRRLPARSATPRLPTSSTMSAARGEITANR